jgi:hypothetical protein
MVISALFGVSMAEEASDQGFQRRMPSTKRKVSEIKAEDIRVSILGTVIDRQGEKVVIDDGTGKIDAVFDKEVKAEPNQLVRVFGRVIPMENGFELQGEILQDMSKLDMKLYNKVMEAVKE